MPGRRKKLGEILVGWNLLSPNALADAISYASEHGKRIGEALVELELVKEEDVTKALASQFDLEYVDLDKNVGVTSALDLVPTKLISQYKILPLSVEDGRMKVIISDPLNLELLDLLRFRLNMEIECALAPVSKIERFISTFIKDAGTSVDEAIEEIDRDGELLKQEQSEYQKQLAEADADAPVIKLIDLIIREAVRGRASDIHVEPMADRVRVRYRVDGVCLVRDNIPKSMQGAVLARLKIMAGIDIAEKRVPQDGRIKMKFGNQMIDFRVSSCPAYHGESVVLRILRLIRCRSPSPAWASSRTTKSASSHHPPAERRVPGHGADRLRQDHDALCRPARAEPPGPQDHHGRGPGRVQLHRHEPVPGEGGNRADLWAHSTRHVAPGPQHHPGRRDS